MAWLRHEALRLRKSQPLSALGLVQAACVDGTDFPAWSSRDPHDTRKDLGNRDAMLGRGKKGFVLGYQSLFLVDAKGLPLGYVEASVNANEKNLEEPPGSNKDLQRWLKEFSVFTICKFKL